MKKLLFLLLLTGCSSPDSAPNVAAPTTAPRVVALPKNEPRTDKPIIIPPADTAAFRAMLGAPSAVLHVDGPFDGRWYRKLEDEAGMEFLTVGHDTLGRYLINLGPTNRRSYRSIEAFAAYTSGDSLRIFGNPDHHSPAMGLHLGAGGRRMILSYATAGLMDRAHPFMVRDTFWRDSTRMRR